MILETERLILREFELDDDKDMFALNQDFEVIRYTGDGPFESVAATRAFLENYSDYKRNGFGRWVVIRKEDGKTLGWCGLKRHDDGMVDLGYRFFRDEWGKGYATESALGCLKYGFETLLLPQIIARVDPENKASINVIEKLGFTFWKTDVCHGVADARIYLLKQEEFSIL
ncbi:MAG: GNAT family N-acetyltransferase [Cryomorphaceae bacterium]|nr:GNAT family N-acetyltransferase [Cryomorphaceae bacterium]